MKAFLVIVLVSLVLTAGCYVTVEYLNDKKVAALTAEEFTAQVLGKVSHLGFSPKLTTCEKAVTEETTTFTCRTDWLEEGVPSGVTLVNYTVIDRDRFYIYSY